MRSRIVYSMRIALKLIEMCYETQAVMPNPKNTRYNCWVFADSPEFAQDLSAVIRAQERGGRNG